MSTLALGLAALLASLASASLSAAIVTPCETSQVTFGLQGETPASADACFGWIEEFGNPGFEVALVESHFGTDPAEPWSFVLKDAGGGASGGFTGLEFTLSADQGTAGTYYVLSWSDPAPADLPVNLDLAFVLKSGQGTGGFLFDDLALPASPNSGGGTYEIGVLNNQGRPLALSHTSLIMRRGDTTTIPEPAPLALLASGLLALGLRRRR